MKSRQFCSVCKDWLDMEVVPTNDGDDDDGVVWYRCPQCQGFLPKLKDAADEAAPAESAESIPEETNSNSSTDSADTMAPQENQDDNLPWDSPAAMMRDQKEPAKEISGEPESDDDVLVGVTFDTVVEPETAKVVEKESEPGGPEPETKFQAKAKPKEDTKPKEDPEPIMEYAAMLAETGVAEAVPYRPWESYEVGQCINHLAWNDCGVVVAKEELPGARKIIKCYFEEAGVVRLIEEAPR